MKSYLPKKIKDKTAKMAVPKSNIFVLNFNVLEADRKLSVDKAPFSFDAVQYPALMQGDNLSQLGVDVLCNVLVNCIKQIADLHEESTGVPASKIREKVISKLEVGKRVKLIGV